MELNNKNILVAGGAGFIGSHLVETLIAKGAKVRVIDNLANGEMDNIKHNLDNKNFEFYLGSITDPFDVFHVMKNIDVVFNLATLGVRHSIKHPYENHKVNAEGTLLLLQAARETGVERFLFCSSSEVYGTAKYVPMTESHPTLPHTVYGASKLAGESYTRAFFETYGMSTIVVRPFNTYGPRSHYAGDAGEVIPKSIIRALNGKELLVFGDGLQTRDFTYVTDTATALVKAIETDDLIGKTVNIGCNFEISIKELAYKIIELVDNKQAKVKLSKSRPGDVLRLYADPAKFTSATQWRPKTDFTEGLLKTIKWFSEELGDIRGLLKNDTIYNWE